MRGTLAIACVVLAARTARAKDTVEVTAAKKLLDAQVHALGTADAAAFAATFDDRGYVILPIADEGTDRATIDAASKKWLAGLGTIKVTVDHPRFGQMDYTHAAWISAEVVATGATTVRWRVTELVTARQPNDSGVGYTTDPKLADMRVLAACWSEPIDDKDALALAAAGALPALPAIPDSSDYHVDDEFDPKQLGGLAPSSDPAMTVIGSAPKELYYGKSAAMAALRSWKSLVLQVQTGKSYSDGNGTVEASYSVAHVTITYKSGGTSVAVPFRALRIENDGGPATRLPNYLVVVHFSIARK